MRAVRYSASSAPHRSSSTSRSPSDSDVLAGSWTMKSASETTRSGNSRCADSSSSVAICTRIFFTCCTSCCQILDKSSLARAFASAPKPRRAWHRTASFSSLSCWAQVRHSVSRTPLFCPLRNKDATWPIHASVASCRVMSPIGERVACVCVCMCVCVRARVRVRE